MSEILSEPKPQGTFWEVLRVFTKLGLTSFGGPVAHLGYFRAELVERRKWLDDESYADLLALCQFLPGPASSQTGIGIGIARAGLWGGLAAWLGFTLPSAFALIVFALGVKAIGDLSQAGWLHGLKIVAVAVVAYAIWGMATKLTPDRPRITLAVGAAVLTLIWQTSLAQILIIVAGGLLGGQLFAQSATRLKPSQLFRIPKRLGAVLLSLFFLLLFVLPLLRELTGNFYLAVFDAFYRAGSLVFGGGHVVLPLLQAEVVPTGWVDTTSFIAGYGAAQAVPGPLFTFSAYLGASMQAGLLGIITGLVALAGIYLPSFLLLIGVLPFWDSLRRFSSIKAALKGVNAVVVGILIAALYKPVWTSAIFAPLDFALALMAFLLLAIWKWPAWLVVLLSAGAGAGITFFV